MSAIERSSVINSASSTAVVPLQISPPVMTHSIHTRTMEAWLKVRSEVFLFASSVESLLIESCYALIENSTLPRITNLLRELGKYQHPKIVEIINPILAQLQTALNLQRAETLQNHISKEEWRDSSRVLPFCLNGVKTALLSMSEGPARNYMVGLHDSNPFASINEEFTLLGDLRSVPGNRQALHVQYLRIFRENFKHNSLNMLVLGSDMVGLMHALLGWMNGYEVHCVRSKPDQPDRAVILSDNNLAGVGSIGLLRWFGILDYLRKRDWGVENPDKTFTTSSSYLENAIEHLITHLDPNFSFYPHQHVSYGIKRKHCVFQLGATKVYAKAVVIADEELFAVSKLNISRYQLTDTLRVCTAIFEKSTEENAIIIAGKRKSNASPADGPVVKRPRGSQSLSVEPSVPPPAFKYVKAVHLPQKTILELGWEGDVAASEKCMSEWARHQLDILAQNDTSSLSSVSLSASRIDICSRSGASIGFTRFLLAGNAKKRSCLTSKRWHDGELNRYLQIFYQLADFDLDLSAPRLHDDSELKRSLHARWFHMQQPPLLDLFLRSVKIESGEPLHKLLQQAHFTQFLRENGLSHPSVDFRRSFSAYGLSPKNPLITSVIKGHVRHIPEQEVETDSESSSDAEDPTVDPENDYSSHDSLLAGLVSDEIAARCLHDSQKFYDELMNRPEQFFETFGLGALPQDLLVHLQQLVYVRNHAMGRVQTEYFSEQQTIWPRTMLLSGPSGTGKSLIAKTIGLLLNIQHVWIIRAQHRTDLDRFRAFWDNNRDKDARFLVVLDNVDRLNEINTGIGDIIEVCDTLSLYPNVFVVGTALSLDLLDPEVTSSGRLFPLFKLAKPDLEGRKSILRIHLKDLRERGLLHEDVDVNGLAVATEGMVGATIEAFIQKVYLAWASEGKAERIGMKDFKKILQGNNSGDKDTSRLLSHPREYLEEMGVGGMPDDCIQVLQSIVLEKTRLDANNSGIKACRGIMLSGPPGTGKTTLARNLAKILKVPDSNVRLLSGSDFLKQYVGQSEEMVRKVFAAATSGSYTSQHSSDLQLIIIDEIDAVIAKRSDLHSFHSKNLVNQFLYEVDGLLTKNNILVVGITNNLTTVDPAALRPGRLHPTINISLPDLAARKAIFKIHMQKLVQQGSLDPDVSYDRLAEATEGLSGADISGLVHDVYLGWMLRNVSVQQSSLIRMEDFEKIYRRTPVAIPKPLFDTPEQYLEEIGVAAMPKVCIEYLQNVVLSRSEFADDLHRSNIKIPRGIILSGPPGTGKTTLAVKLGTILGIPSSRVISRSGASFMSKWVGDSAANVRELFAPIQAESKRSGNYSDPFLVIIDEADALLGKRDSHHQEQRGALTTFLEYVDGLQKINNVFIIAITNRPDDIDPAVARPGRLHPTITIDNPDEKGRVALFRLHTKAMVVSGLMDSAIDFGPLAKQTQGMNGSHIASIIQSASLARLRRKVLGRGDQLVTNADLLNAIREAKEKMASDAPPPGIYN